MSRVVVYLARHGETEWNRAGRWQGHTDVPLSEAGRLQAAALAERLRGAGITRLAASDLARARETAEIVARHLGVAGVVAVDPDLRERSFGCFEGLTREECAQRYPEIWERYRADPRHTPPGAEAQDRLVERMLAAVRRASVIAPASATRGAGSGALLVVSHGGSIRAFVAHVTGARPPPLGNTALFRLRAEGDAFDGVEQLA